MRTHAAGNAQYGIGGPKEDGTENNLDEGSLFNNSNNPILQRWPFSSSNIESPCLQQTHFQTFQCNCYLGKLVIPLQQFINSIPPPSKQHYHSIMITTQATQKFILDGIYQHLKRKESKHNQQLLIEVLGYKFF